MEAGGGAVSSKQGANRAGFSVSLGTEMDKRVSPDLNIVLLRDVQAPRWVDYCAFLPEHFGVPYPIDGGVR